MGEFTMPSLGADMDAGVLQEWLVGPGDAVRKGDPVAVVETAKSTIEVECFETGTVERLIVEPGTTVPVGTPLAVIAGEPAMTAEPVVTTGPAESVPPAAGRPAAPAPSGAPAADATLAPVARDVRDVRSPLVRRLAKAGGVDLTTLHGSGRGGVITRADVERAAGAAAPTATPAARRLAAELGVDLSRVTGRGSRGTIRVAEVRKAAAALAAVVPGGRTEPPAAGPARPPAAAPPRPHVRPGAARIRATPLARRVAAELGVDLSTVPGTGECAAVRVADVRLAAATPRGTGLGPSAPRTPSAADSAAGPTTVQLPGADDRSTAMRRAIADLMSRSKREIPHYYLSTTVDLHAALTWMREHNRRSPLPERLIPGALLLKAAAVAARQVPELNGFWTDGRFVPGSGVHLGVAVALRGGGLIAPALHDADTLKLPELMAALKDLVARTRKGRLRGSETADPTITVTSLGDQGVEAVFGVIYPPQVALVGFGRVVERPCAVGGLLGVRPVVTATLSADHRATDGAVGARYLAAVDHLLQRPEEL